MRAHHTDNARTDRLRYSMDPGIAALRLLKYKRQVDPTHKPAPAAKGTSPTAQGAHHPKVSQAMPPIRDRMLMIGGHGPLMRNEWKRSLFVPAVAWPCHPGEACS